MVGGGGGHMPGLDPSLLLTVGGHPSPGGPLLLHHFFPPLFPPFSTPIRLSPSPPPSSSSPFSAPPPSSISSMPPWPLAPLVLIEDGVHHTPGSIIRPPLFFCQKFLQKAFLSRLYAHPEKLLSILRRQSTCNFCLWKTFRKPVSCQIQSLLPPATCCSWGMVPSFPTLINGPTESEGSSHRDIIWKILLQCVYVFCRKNNRLL